MIGGFCSSRIGRGYNQSSAVHPSLIRKRETMKEVAYVKGSVFQLRAAVQAQRGCASDGLEENSCRINLDLKHNSRSSAT